MTGKDSELDGGHQYNILPLDEDEAKHLKQVSYSKSLKSVTQP